MKIDNLDSLLAAGMDQALEDNKDMFSKSNMLEKLAFKKVSEEDATTEIEQELMTKKAGCCECSESAKSDKCECKCHKDTAKEGKGKVDEKTASVAVAINPVKEAFNSLLKISEVLDTYGFERLAAASALLADKLIVEAKAKKSKSKSEKSSKEKSDKKSKMNIKERMEKIRAGKKGGEADKKSEKSTEKKSTEKSAAPRMSATQLRVLAGASPVEEIARVLAPLGYSIQPGTNPQALADAGYVDISVKAGPAAKWKGQHGIENQEVKKVLDPITTALFGLPTKPIIYTDKFASKK